MVYQGKNPQTPIHKLYSFCIVMIVTVMELTHIVTKKCVSVSQNRKKCFLHNIRHKESQLREQSMFRSYCTFVLDKTHAKYVFIITLNAKFNSNRSCLG